MTKQNTTELENKLQYTSPALIEFGTMEELTQGPSAGFADGFGTGVS